MITAEAKKLELAKLAFPKVTDPNNYAEINMLFSSQASRDEMDRFITNSSGAVVSTTNPANIGGITNAQYNALLRAVRNQYQQEGKVALLSDEFNNNNQFFTSSQVQQLISLVTSESNRLKLAKLAYARVSDKQNFSTLNNLFALQSSRDELNYFV